VSEFKNREEYEKWKANRFHSNEEELAQQANRKSFPESLINCPRCRTKISINASVCPKCGTILTDQIRSAEVKSKKYTSIIILISFFLLMILLAGIREMLNLSTEGDHERVLSGNHEKYYWIPEGQQVQHLEGPDVLHLSTSKESVFLHSLTSSKVALLNRDDFAMILKSGTLREATQGERFNAQWYTEKRDYHDVVFSVNIRGTTVSKGDLADDVFGVFTKYDEINEPYIGRSIDGEMLHVSHTYMINGVEYTIGFRRLHRDSNDYCRDCPWRLYGITIYPNKSLTFKEYRQKYWYETK